MGLLLPRGRPGQVHEGQGRLAASPKELGRNAAPARQAPPAARERAPRPLAARIVAVADVYDALRSNRCYRQSLSVDETLGIVRKDAQAGRLDGRVVEELERRVERIERDLAGPLPDEESIWFRLGAV